MSTVTKEQLIVKLFRLGCFKEGNVTLKSGKISNYYIDLRNLISHPQLLMSISDLLYQTIFNIEGKVCGLPYAGIPYANCISILYKRPMVLLRKERKIHGTGKMVEGDYKEGEDLIIIDDILTTGTSIIESLEHLKEFKIRKIIVVVDREEGGRKKLEDMGYIVESLFSIKTFMGINTLLNCKLYPKRNLMVKKIKDVIKGKKSNICVSMDYVRCSDIINSIKILKDNIVMVKLHCDIIEDFSDNFIKELVEICESNKIFIFEDRKFGDIGSTFKKQFMGGIYKIQSWCNITNFHSLVGEGIVKEFSKCRNSNQGGLLIAQMSNEGNLLDDQYMKKTIEIAEKHREDIIGFICQKKIADSEFIYMIPGINIDCKEDNSDQQYITPQEAMERGGDIMIIGRGIIGKENILEECRKYQEIGWRSYQEKNVI